MANSPIIYGPNGATSLVPGGVTLPGSTSGTIQIQPAAVTTPYGLVMPSVQGTANTVLKNDGTGVLSWALGGGAIPSTVTRFLSGSGTYTTPAGVSYLKITVVGAGGGGQGSGTAGQAAAGTGGTTTFGTSLLTATGGAGGTFTSVPGGTATVNSPAISIIATAGGSGIMSGSTATSSTTIPAGAGASSPLGGAGSGGPGNAVGFAAATNSGSGGGGGGINASTQANPGIGGAAGGYIQAYISSPVSTYPYSVGAAGTAGAAGTSGFSGGLGGSGIVVIEEIYAPIAISTAAGGAIAPVVTTLLSGSGTYTTPAGVTYIQVKGIGGGGGGGSSGTTNTGATGGTGGSTSFGTSLLVGNGGAGGQGNNASQQGGAGGTASVASSSTVLQVVAVQGGEGGSGNNQSGVTQLPGGIGASGPFGGNGMGAQGGNVAGFAAIANTGAGGGGASSTTSVAGGGGGGAGGYFEAIITSPLSSYSFTVGAGGTGAAAGSGGNLGGVGGSGVIIVTAYMTNGAVGTATTITGTVAGSQVAGPLQSAIVQGVTNGSNATAGYIGEYISSNPVSPVSVGSTGAFVTITSISLTAGDWDVEANLQISPGGTTAATEFTGALSLNATSLDSSSNGAITQVLGTLAVASVSSYPIGKRRFNLSSTTTVFLVGELTYTVSGSATWNVNNLIQARRVR